MPRDLAHMGKTPAAKATPQSPAATAGAREAEALDAASEPTLRQLAAVLNDIQAQFGGYGAQLDAIEQTGSEDGIEDDAEDGVEEGCEPPAPTPCVLASGAGALRGRTPRVAFTPTAASPATTRTRTTRRLAPDSTLSTTTLARTQAAPTVAACTPCSGTSSRGPRRGTFGRRTDGRDKPHRTRGARGGVNSWRDAAKRTDPTNPERDLGRDRSRTLPLQTWRDTSVQRAAQLPTLSWPCR